MLDVLIDASPAARDSAQRCPFSDIHVGGSSWHPCPIQKRQKVSASRQDGSLHACAMDGTKRRACGGCFEGGIVSSGDMRINTLDSSFPDVARHHDRPRWI